MDMRPLVSPKGNRTAGGHVQGPAAGQGHLLTHCHSAFFSFLKGVLLLYPFPGSFLFSDQRKQRSSGNSQENIFVDSFPLAMSVLDHTSNTSPKSAFPQKLNVSPKESWALNQAVF